MSLRSLFSWNRHSTADQASRQSDRPPTYVSNVEAPPSYVSRPPIDRVRAWSARISGSSPFLSGPSEGDSETIRDGELSLGEWDKSWSRHPTEVDTDPRRSNSIGLASDSSSGQTGNPSDHGATTRYLYYRLYSKDRDLRSKASFDPKQPSLGRIRADSVPPPHRPASIKQCIARVECMPGLTFGDLYATRSSTTPMKERIVSLLVGDCPGLTQDCPMALVQTLVRIQAITDNGYESHTGKRFLRHEKGDIFFTNGVVKKTSVINGHVVHWYEATNSAGRKGRE